MVGWLAGCRGKKWQFRESGTGPFGGVCAREIIARSTAHPCSNDDDDDEGKMDEEAAKV